MTKSSCEIVLQEARPRHRTCWRRRRLADNCSVRDIHEVAAAVAELEDHTGTLP